LSEGHFESPPTPKLWSAAPADLRERGEDATVIRDAATDGTRVVGELRRPQGKRGQRTDWRGPAGNQKGVHGLEVRLWAISLPRVQVGPGLLALASREPGAPEKARAERPCYPKCEAIPGAAESCPRRLCSWGQRPLVPAEVLAPLRSPGLLVLGRRRRLFGAGRCQSPTPNPGAPSPGLEAAGDALGARAVVVPVLYLLVCAVGLGGNALVIYVVLRHAKMKTVTNIYILNLAVADVLLMLGLPFVATQNAISYWPFGPVLCRLVMTLDGINQFTSIFCLTVMSVDRYLAVVHPIRSARWRRPRVAKLASAAVWAFSLVMSLPLVVFADIQEGWNTCNLSWPEPVGLWGAVFIIYTSVLGFFGPLLVICLCYLLIVVKLKASGVRVGSTRRRSERKVTRMVVVVVLVFAGCWLPFFIVNIVNLAFALPEEPASAGAYFFVVVLSYANSCANPLLYGFLSDNFRQSFRKVLCLRKGYGAGAEDADATEPQPGPSSRLQEAMMPVRSCKANGLMQTSKL
ncbi:PREDICTED: somatostatin receptor type 5, partial [Bison bison bison]|uniref:Somatostatin receptor type 5 n=1 Tax=Bison bison bison TaxID=43346 RepID=A0A6P3IMR0_BISBB